MSRHGDTTPLVMSAFAASMLLHAGAIGLFAAVDPRPSGGGMARRTETQLLLAPEVMEPPAPPTPPPPADPPPPAQPPAPEPEPPKEPEVRPGIDDGVADTPAWLGSKEATAHGAPKSTVDQEALSPQPGARAPEGGAESAEARPPAPPRENEADVKPSPEAPADLPEAPQPPVAPAEPQIVPPRDEAPARDASPEAAQTDESPRNAETPVGPLMPAPDDDALVTKDRAREGSPATESAEHDGKAETEGAGPKEHAAEGAGEEAVKVDAEGLLPPTLADPGLATVEPLERPGAPSKLQVEETQPATPEPQHATLMPPTPREVLEATKAAAAPGGAPTSSSIRGMPRTGEGSGRQSDSQSDAAAIKEAVNIRPGRVAAAKGLRITTVRPEWSVVTRATILPRNPVVRIVFGRNGKVKLAEFVKGQNACCPEVDQPLLDALYRWTAEGEALAKLPAGDPEAGVAMSFRVILRDSMVEESR